MGSYQPISRIAIVGAGPSGLATAKYLVAEKTFDVIDVYEQREHVGGIWNLSSPEETKKIPIPQTDPRYGSHGDRNGSKGPSLESLELESPLYNYLETNIPKELMAFSDKRFADDQPLFVGHEYVLQYLEEYADDLRHLIHLNTEVKDIRPLASKTELGRQWEVHFQDLTTREEKSAIYDAIVVANGHYTLPFVPDVSGLDQWNLDYPGTVLHSKAYRKPEDYKNMKVLVVGNSVSGSDIASQIGAYCTKLLLSSRSLSVMGTPPSASWRSDVPGLSEFLPSSQHNRAVKFVDGRIETDIDAVIFATGYFYNFPFLSGLKPQLVTHGLRTEGLYKHLFYINNPTLSFPVLNLRVIPFPLAENQAAVVARVWSGRLELPTKEEMESWERKTIEEQGSFKDFHLLKFPKDANALNEFYRWATTAQKIPGLENEGQGKLGTFWDDRLVWMRSKFPDIKAAYGSKGKERFKIKTIGELGFFYEKGKETERDTNWEGESMEKVRE